jgi:hypothetical protein
VRHSIIYVQVGRGRVPTTGPEPLVTNENSLSCLSSVAPESHLNLLATLGPWPLGHAAPASAPTNDLSLAIPGSGVYSSGLPHCVHHLSDRPHHFCKVVVTSSASSISINCQSRKQMIVGQKWEMCEIGLLINGSSTETVGR